MPSENTRLLLRRAGKLLECLPDDEAEDRLVDFIAELELRIEEDRCAFDPEALIPSGPMEEASVICQVWYSSEKEPGWGVTQRPDGYSLHKNRDEWRAYMTANWGNRDRSAQVPAIYSAPHGSPYVAEVVGAVYIRVLAEGSIRVMPGRLRADPPPMWNPHKEQAHG